MDDKKVVIMTIDSPKTFREFWREDGPFEYVIQGARETDGEEDEFLPTNKWLFSNSFVVVCKEFFHWDERQYTLTWVEPTPAEKEHFSGEWLIPGMKDEFLEVLLKHIDSLPKNLSTLEAEIKFFHLFKKHADELGYYFYTYDDIESKDFEEYLYDWQTDISNKW